MDNPNPHIIKRLTVKSQLRTVILAMGHYFFLELDVIGVIKAGFWLQVCTTSIPLNAIITHPYFIYRRRIGSIYPEEYEARVQQYLEQLQAKDPVVLRDIKWALDEYYYYLND